MINGKKSTIPILTYHSIDSTGSVISTGLQEFRTQMNFLARSDYRTATLEEVVGFVQGRNPFPKKTVAITFDDGFANFFHEASPVLKEYGFRATVFVVTGYCGKNNQWEGQPAEIPALDLMTWEQIARLAEDGIEFGVHTRSHPNLTTLSREAAEDEILESKRMLRESLGRNVMYFAHPYGKTTPQIQNLIRREFAAACSTRMAFTNPDSDIHFLPRIDMYYFSRNQLFSRIGTSQFERYVRYRGLLRSARQRFERMTRH